MKRRLAAGLALASYLLAALVVPVLHRRHHALHGDDHVHGADGTRYFTPPLDDTAFHHAAFDADLAALDLAEVAHAGTLAVDCSLQSYTLADCAGMPADHPHTFGDELLAQAHRHPAPAPFDPSHGRGALEHLSPSLLSAHTFVLPPPPEPVARLELPPAPRSPATSLRTTHLSRGPPLPG
jgi:hypothetical protein